MGSSPSKTTGGSSASPSSSEVTLAKPQYIYYRIFSPAGSVRVKVGVPEDPFLGRALALNVAPPHNISSLTRHICDLEDIMKYKEAKLFKNVFETSPLREKERVDLKSGTGWVGCTPETAVSCVAPGAGPKYQLKALNSRPAHNEDWLPFEKGDILYTDGAPIKLKDLKSGRYWHGFYATDSGGKFGFVQRMLNKTTTDLVFVGSSPTLPKDFEG